MNAETLSKMNYQYTATSRKWDITVHADRHDLRELHAVSIDADRVEITTIYHTSASLRDCVASMFPDHDIVSPGGNYFVAVPRGEAPQPRAIIARYRVEPVHINVEGYDSRGDYFGSGDPVYSVEDTTDNTVRVQYYRAKSAREARAKHLLSRTVRDS